SPTSARLRSCRRTSALACLRRSWRPLRQHRQPRRSKPMSTTTGGRTGQMLFGKIEGMLDRAAAGVEKARAYLFAQQHRDGYWCGELEADTTLESDYIAIHTLLGTGNRGRLERAVPEIIRHQNEDGGWPIYAGGPSNISASVKAYFALKLMGF